MPQPRGQRTTIPATGRYRRPVDLSPWWPDDLPADLRDRLLAAYDDPGRGYHDRLHLAEMLGHLDTIAGDRDDLPLLRLAAWFHDAVYAGAGDDEEQSALLAERELTTAGLPAADVAEVARLVRLTARHRPAPDDEPGLLLCDADLAILAAGAERYATYVAGVRAEYASVPDADFRAGRRAVLVDLLDKPELFGTVAARERWETAARANLRAEIAALS